MDVKVIVEEYLEKNGYDGLYHEDCGCFIADLFPCGEPSETCEPGYRSTRVDIISPKKEGEK